MVVKCVYCGKARGKESVTFHKFPLKKKDKLQEWVKNMNVGAAFTPTESMRLCSDHFTSDSFYKIGNVVLLLDDSIPTLFNPYKLQCVYCTKRKNDNENQTFHKFPIKNTNLLNQWLANMKLLNFSPTDRNFLCSDHFEDSSFYYKQNGKTLKKTAVPTIFIKQEIIEEDETHIAHEETSFMAPPVKLMKEVKSEFAPIALASDAPSTYSNEERNIVPISIENANIKPTNDDPLTKLQMELMAAHRTIRSLKQKLRTRQQKIRRMSKKIISFKEIVSAVRKQGLVPESGLTSLDSIVDSDIT